MHKKHLILDHPVLFGTLFLYLVMVSLLIPNAVYGYLFRALPFFDDTVANELTAIAGYLTVGSIFLLVLRWRLQPDYRFFVNNGLFWRAAAMLWPFFLVILLNLFNHIGDGIITPVFALVSSIGYNFCVGYMEEIVFRGASLTNSMRVWHEKPHRIEWAVALSALPFGLVHLLNYPNGPLTALIQTLYAVAFGMLFAAVYLRTGNLLVCVVVHGLVDVSSDAIFVSQSSGDSIPVVGICIIIALAVLSAAWAAYLLRPAKRSEIEANFPVIGRMES